jgi:hypothetical protein
LFNEMSSLRKELFTARVQKEKCRSRYRPQRIIYLSSAE